MYNLPEVHHIWHLLDIAAEFLLALPRPLGIVLQDVDPRIPGLYLPGCKRQGSRENLKTLDATIKKVIVNIR